MERSSSPRSARFVGRAQELAALAGVLRSATSGRPMAAVVRGEPGSGKSRLLAELRDRRPAIEWLAAQGYPSERSVPFAAAADLLRRVSAIPGAGEVIGDLLNASVPSRTAGSGDELRIFEAAFRSLSALGPAALVIDDVQWFDAHSAALCHYLYRAAHRDTRPVCLILAGRPSPILTELEASLRRVDAARLLELDLTGLDTAAAREMAAQLAPDLDPRSVETAWREVGGVPFWLERLLSRSDDAGSGTAIEVDLAGLSHDAASLLALLACAARPVPVDEVAGLLGWSDERRWRVAEELLAAGLATEEVGAYRPAHELVSEARLRQVPEAARRRLHRSLAARLETQAGDDVRQLLDALSQQELAGGDLVGLATRIATASNRRLAGRPGLARLVDIIDAASPRDPRLQELRPAVADLAADLGAHDQALRLWQATAKASDSVLRAHASLAASRSALELGLRAEARQLLAGVEQDARPGSPLAVELQAHRSSILRFLEHRGPEARAAAADAVAAARQLVATAPGGQLSTDARAACLTAFQAGCDAAMMADEPGELLALADELSVLAAEWDERTHVRALAQGALALRFLGRNADAERRLAAAWNQARRRVLPQATLEVGNTLSIVRLSLGRIAEADQISRECLALGERLAEFGPARAFSVVLPHLVQLSRGNWRSATAGLAAAAAAEADPHYRLHAHLERAVALSRLDADRAADDVRADVRAAMACAARAGCLRCRLECLARGGEALSRIGSVGDAQRLLQQWRSLERPASDRLMAWWGTRAEAVMAAASRRPGATDQLADLIGSAARLQLHLEAVWARIDLGRALIDDDRGRAAATLREAGAEAEHMGAVTEQAVAEQLLRGLGVRTWRRRPRSEQASARESPARMTARESEIAALAAHGASNPEIAAALFLSRKTVERHLSNAMAKLGVRNRSELAGAVGAGTLNPKIEGAAR